MLSLPTPKWVRFMSSLIGLKKEMPLNIRHKIQQFCIKSDDINYWILITSLIKKTLYYIASISTPYSVDGHFHDTFFTSPIQPNLTFLLAQFMYFILFHSFKYDPSPCDIFGEIKRVWFGGYGPISFGPFAWV